MFLTALELCGTALVCLLTLMLLAIIGKSTLESLRRPTLSGSPTARQNWLHDAFRAAAPVVPDRLVGAEQRQAIATEMNRYLALHAIRLKVSAHDVALVAEEERQREARRKVTPYAALINPLR